MAIVAVTVISGEYSTGMIRLTLTATPSRWRVLTAKGAVVGAATLVTGAVAVLASVLAGGLLLGRHVRRKLKEQWNKPTGRAERVKINTIGFFYESPDVGAFLWALARENDGSFVGMSRP